MSASAHIGRFPAPARDAEHHRNPAKLPRAPSPSPTGRPQDGVAIVQPVWVRLSRWVPFAQVRRRRCLSLSLSLNRSEAAKSGAESAETRRPEARSKFTTASARRQAQGRGAVQETKVRNEKQARGGAQGPGTDPPSNRSRLPRADASRRARPRLQAFPGHPALAPSA